MHLGNARTALFNWLFARAHGGSFLIRSEDTDVERSDEGYLEGLLDGLTWLGLDWDDAPDREPDETIGALRQSQRQSIYAAYLDRLVGNDQAYPCFCTQAELAAARKRQLAAGQPPRYPGTCAHLNEGERQARRQAGRSATLRFRVADQGTIGFDDRIHGRQRFRLADIGDFVIARADGVPAFFFANAVDDALMGVTEVLRGDDHLTNTPRQLLLLRALGLEAPRYGHFPLILGDDGKPLSKRHGAASLDELRAAGYRPLALVNHLARIGYRPDSEDLLTLDAWVAGFDLERVGHAGARHNPEALDVWQRRAVERMDMHELTAWIEAHRPAQAPALPVDAGAFLEAVRSNVTLARDAWYWAERLFDPDAEPEPDAGAVVAAAGPLFFRAAAQISDPDPSSDFKGWTKALARATGQRGRGLYKPLRAALTGAVAGPELDRIVPLIPPHLRRQRLLDAGAD
jgi:glutamyl-tRNA synthetase